MHTQIATVLDWRLVTHTNNNSFYTTNFWHTQTTVFTLPTCDNTQTTTVFTLPTCDTHTNSNSFRLLTCHTHTHIHTKPTVLDCWLVTPTHTHTHKIHSFRLPASYIHTKPTVLDCWLVTPTHTHTHKTHSFRLPASYIHTNSNSFRLLTPPPPPCSNSLGLLNCHEYKQQQGQFKVTDLPNNNIKDNFRPCVWHKIEANTPVSYILKLWSLWSKTILCGPTKQCYLYSGASPHAYTGSWLDRMYWWWRPGPTAKTPAVCHLEFSFSAHSAQRQTRML